MELLDFINSHESWEEQLTGAPYYILVKYQGPYVLLEYQQFVSDMTNILCQQARGSIFRKNDEGKWIAISIGMFKFFNYGQPEAAVIDWNDPVYVTEKVDGSNIRLAYDHIEGKWLCSTTGTIDAQKALLPNGRNFKSEFISVLGGPALYSKLCTALSKQYTYYFELVSRANKIVVNYDEEAIYYLGCRDMITFEERGYSRTNQALLISSFGIRTPKSYKLSSLNECVAAAEALGENAEGFVVCDAKTYQRVKVKSPWYVAMHHMRGNGILTSRRVCQMWREDLLDDYVGNFPEYNEFVEKVMDKIKEVASTLDFAWEEGASHFCGERKELAATINKIFTPLCATYVFARLDGKVQNGAEWLKKWPYRKLGDYIASQLDITEYGVEDEI